ELNMYDEEWPIWTYQEQMPPAKFVFDDENRRGIAVDSLVAGGDIISGATIRRSLLFSRVNAYDGALVEDSVVLQGVDIGAGAKIRRAVIDKRCKIPPGMQIGYDLEEDRRRFHVSEKGIVLVTQDMLGQRAPRIGGTRCRKSILSCSGTCTSRTTAITAAPVRRSSSCPGSICTRSRTTATWRITWNATRRCAPW